MTLGTRHWIGIGLGIMLLISMLMPKDQTSIAPQPWAVRRPTVGCLSQDTYAWLYQLTGDPVAVRKALSVVLATGECMAFKLNETVEVMDVAMGSGWIKIRRPGDPLGYWTSIRNVDH